MVFEWYIFIRVVLTYTSVALELWLDGWLSLYPSDLSFCGPHTDSLVEQGLGLGLRSNLDYVR